MRQGKVYINGVFAGLLTEHDRHHYEFDYDNDYIARQDSQAVCLAMPINKTHYESEFLFPFFANLLSEGENRIFQSRLLKIDEKDDFGILLATAGYDTIGRVTVKPVES